MFPVTRLDRPTRRAVVRRAGRLREAFRAAAHGVLPELPGRAVDDPLARARVARPGVGAATTRRAFTRGMSDFLISREASGMIIMREGSLERKAVRNIFDVDTPR